MWKYIVPEINGNLKATLSWLKCSFLLGVLYNFLRFLAPKVAQKLGIIYTLPETNIFAPENGWLED